MADTSKQGTEARMTLRIPGSVYQLVTERAYLERRSMTGQLLHMAESGLSRPRISKLIAKVELPVMDDVFVKHHIRIPAYLYTRLVLLRNTTGVTIKDLFTAMTLIYCEDASLQFSQAITRTLQQRLPEDVFNALVDDAFASSVPVIEKVIDRLITFYSKP